jgi:hypothetical protein
MNIFLCGTGKEQNVSCRKFSRRAMIMVLNFYATKTTSGTSGFRVEIFPET